MYSLTLAALVGAAAANDGEMFSTKSYQASDAASKQEMLWNKIIADKTPSSFPSKLEFAGLFAEPMAPSFETVADAMPNTWGGFSWSLFDS